jgi:hypothetical protein
MRKERGVVGWMRVGSLKGNHSRDAVLVKGLVDCDGICACVEAAMISP